MKPSLLNISKTMAFATAIGAASAAWATVFPGSTDFEDVTLPDDYTEGTAAIINDAAPDVASRPAHYNYASSQTNVLEIDTGADAPVFRKLNADGTNEVGTIYVDMLVKPTAIFAPDASPTPGSTDKLLVYFKEYPAGTTNLCVYAGYDNDGLTKGECFLSSPVDKDTWYRLVIEAKTLQEAYPGFNVYLGGYGSDFRCERNGDPDFYSLLIDPDNYDPANPLPSEVAKVGFAGSGYVDDFVASDIDPNAVVTVSCTLSWPTTLTSVSYTLDGEDGDALTIANGSATIQGTNGAPVTLTGSIGYASKTVNGSISENGTISLPEIDISYYFPLTATADQDGTAEHPYEIADVNGLNALQAAVAAGKAGNAVFAQTANIDMASAGAFSGIGAYGDAALTHADAKPFTGTYDGQGYKISNITFTDRDYAGVFNRVDGGTIKNLTVENVGYVGTGSKYCASIVGYALNGATLENLVSTGTFGSQEKPGKHNMAGIVIRVSGGTNTVNGTQILNCTNNATIYGEYTKLAGICAISQEKHPVANNPKMVFTGCANNGTLILKRNSDGITGFAGIVGYSDVNTTMTDCSNTGTLTQLGTGYNTDHTGALIGMTYGHSITDGGGNSAASTDKMIGYYGSGTVTGFKYATIASGVATTVLPPLAAGATYLLEGNVAASATPVATLTAVGDTIAFDKSLGYTFAGTVGNSGAAGIPQMTEANNVVTYTAGYFPRTATAGQDGTAANPYEIADVDDLAAFKAYVDNGAGRSLSYKLTADIDASSLCPWTGIGTFVKAPTLTSFPTGNGFDGVLNGNGKTISNVTFAKNKTYGGFFNTLDGTVRNLTINIAGFEDKTVDEVGYAAFAGMAFRATFENCVATGTIGTTEKPATHTCGGFAVKSVNPVFVNCTNYVNIVNSLTDNPKIGGFVGLSEGAFLTNCWNYGNMTITLKTCGNAGNGAGGLIGYTQTRGSTVYGGGNYGTIQSTDTTAAASSTYPIYVGTIVAKAGSTVAVSGGTVAQADAISAGVRNNVNGLDFATVDNNVATFVSTLESNNTYKVMLSGATATYAFAAPGTISFDTNLVQNVSFSGITKADSLTLTETTADGVVTFTAATAIPTWATDVDGQSVIDQEVSNKYAAWATNVAKGDTTGDRSAQFLMNVPVAAEVALTIDGIEVTSDGTIVTIGATKTIGGTTTPITLGTTDDGVDTPAINGILNVVVADSISELSSTTAKKAIPAANLVFVNGKAEVLIPATDGKFVKASVDYSTPASEITEVTE